MTTLQQFLSYRTECPLCQASLSTYLQSTRSQTIRYESDRMIVIFPLLSLNKRQCKNYNIGYSFGLHDNSFCIEFYSDDRAKFDDNIPIHLINKFLAFNKNLKGYHFYRTCRSCKSYYYASNWFGLSLKDCSISCEEEFCAAEEYFGFIQTTSLDNERPYRIYKLLNNYLPSKNCSRLTFLDSVLPYDAHANWTLPQDARSIGLPLIPFVNSKDTLDRIKNLVAFS
jgi:hypothetical protein